MNYDKPFKTLDEQLNILRARGLEIYDEDKGKHILLTASYYDLINGYKDIFMPNDQFKPGTTIEKLFVFDFMDKSVQALTMKYGLMVEVKFKAHLAYILAKNIGVHQDDYLDAKHYKRKVNRNLTFLKVKEEINKQLNVNFAKHPTKHYLKKHNHVPPWILFKNVSLGTSINLFKCLNSSNKSEVANLLIPSNKLETKEKIALIMTAMEGIRRFRNFAAHNLNFVKCRTQYNIPGESLYKLLPKGVIRRYNGKIAQKDKYALKGIFGIILSIFILVNDVMIQKCMISEFSAILAPNSDELIFFKKEYAHAMDIPCDISERLPKLEVPPNYKL